MFLREREREREREGEGEGGCHIWSVVPSFFAKFLDTHVKTYFC